ncbi:DUF488 family protein [Bdellovibrio sp. HCB337]|uniref:DUF488 domain-containing protein n=1 Tax=Bdellovibrio sp. HCB337 TaxID=3394358 RepID=UPI0039A69306
MKIFTVGYEGASIEQFVSFLNREGIELIADVRKNPVSRKKGFSKRQLAAHLGEKNIEYLHLPGLGMPTEWRKKAKAQIITRQRMFQDYVKKVLPKQSEEIQLLRKLLREKKTCLLCFEADPSDCHRRNISDEIQRVDKKVKVEDLDVFAGAALKIFSPTKTKRPPGEFPTA